MKKRVFALLLAALLVATLIPAVSFAETTVLQVGADKTYTTLDAAMAGNMASFMDRVFYSAGCGGNRKAFKLKPASAVICARRAGTTATYDQINKYFGINQMPIIS